MIDDFTSIDKNGNYIAKSFFDMFSNRDFILFDTYSAKKANDFSTFTIFQNQFSTVLQTIGIPIFWDLSGLRGQSKCLLLAGFEMLRDLCR